MTARNPNSSKTNGRLPWPCQRGQGRAYAFIVQYIDHQGDECVFWPFATTVDGQGQFGHLGKLYKAHIFMCEKAHGPRPTPGHVVRITCGNSSKSCINPRHMKWMTRPDARKHATEQGVYKRAATRRTYLNEKKVAEIRASQMSLKALSLQYSVAVRHVSFIRSNTFWIDGKRGQRGWASDDPRWILRHPKRVLTVPGAPAVRRIPEFAYLEAFIPQGWPEADRDDIRTTMIMAVLEGGIAARDHIIATRGATFRTSFYRENHERFGTLSLDMPMLDGRSWHDVLSGAPT